MSYTDKRIIESYSGLFEGLSSSNKMKLIETISKSLKVEKDAQEVSFYKSFGAFSSTPSAEEIVKDIKASRKFRKKEISLL